MYVLDANIVCICCGMCIIYVLFNMQTNAGGVDDLLYDASWEERWTESVFVE